MPEEAEVTELAGRIEDLVGHGVAPQSLPGPVDRIVKGRHRRPEGMAVVGTSSILRHGEWDQARVPGSSHPSSLRG